jgi:hypothetical protein
MQAKILNQIPKESTLYKDIKNEERSIVYKLASIRREDTPGNKRQEIIPGSENIPTYDVVTDPETGEDYPIMLIRKVTPEGEAVPAEIDLGVNNFGRIIIDPKNATPYQKAMYKFLEATDFNGSNEGRNKRKVIKFFRINDHEISDKNVTKKKFIHEINTLVFELNEEETLAVARVCSVPHVDSISHSQRQEAILKAAEGKPDEVKLILNDVNSDIEAALREAKERDIIGHDKNKGIFTYGKDEVFTYGPGVMVKPYKLFADHVSRNKREFIVTINQKLRVAKELEKK